jgi:hypothetical protein
MHGMTWDTRVPASLYVDAGVLLAGVLQYQLTHVLAAGSVSALGVHLCICHTGCCPVAAEEQAQPVQQLTGTCCGWSKLEGKWRPGNRPVVRKEAGVGVHSSAQCVFSEGSCGSWHMKLGC